jgi:ribosomal protein S18 acetylase RimI-like enzyme
MWQARLQSVADGREWLFFACFDGEIVGMMGAYRPKDVEGTAVIWGVHVDRAQRGQGIGGKLMARLLDELRRAGIERVMLTVSREQAVAVGLYKKFGFAVVGDGREHIEYVMERDLQYGSMLRSPNTTYQGGRGQEQRQLDALAYDGEKGDGEQRPSARSRDM